MKESKVDIFFKVKVDVSPIPLPTNVESRLYLLDLIQKLKDRCYAVGKDSAGEYSPDFTRRPHIKSEQVSLTRL